MTRYFDDNAKKEDDERKQYTTSPTKNYDYTAELTYSEPVSYTHLDVYKRQEYLMVLIKKNLHNLGIGNHAPVHNHKLLSLIHIYK